MRMRSLINQDEGDGTIDKREMELTFRKQIWAQGRKIGGNIRTTHQKFEENYVIENPEILHIFVEI